MNILTLLRTPRIFGIALFDIITAYIGLYFIIRLLFPNRPRSFYHAWTLVLLLPISVISHIVFGVPTMLNYYLGISTRP